MTELAVRFARDLGLRPPQVAALGIAGQLHDIGKIAVPDTVLRKPAPLTSEEDALVRQHVAFGERMLRGIPHEASVRSAIAHHHEWWDGSGYPRGKGGRAIPLAGRVLALADSFSAMVDDRPYRSAMPIEEAIAAIRAGAGSQFDPALVEPFVATVEQWAVEARAAEEGALGRVGA
ncbi:MAG: HD domain-containing protein [Chloroflexota bacterium]|nr:HD domain-containing protein [Chloroflexota bacterium]